MKTLNRVKFLSLTLAILIQVVFIPVSKVCAATAPDLGTAGSFSVLGFSTVTNTGSTTLSGDLGVWSGSAITGFFGTTEDDGPGLVSGAVHQTDGVAQQAQADALTADGVLLSQAKTEDLGALDSLVLVPGVYDLGAGSLGGGVLTLDGPGVYIFRTTSSLTSAGSVSLINGARACDVFWHVESAATINGSSFVGTIIAKTGITLGTNVSLDGRALAIGDAITLEGNAISGPTCAAAPTSTPGPTSSPSLDSSSSSSSDSSSSSSSDSVCPTISDQVATPIIIESRRVDADSIYISWGPYSGTDTFNVRYGLENGNWLYNTDVTGFSATINALPPNQPIWFQIAARNSCSIGVYGASVLAGGTISTKFIGFPDTGNPRLPNAGVSPNDKSIPWIVLGVLFFNFVVFYLIYKERKFLSK